MKHIPGKFLLLLTLWLVTLQAEDFSFNYHIQKHNPYVKEPLLLSIDLNQTNHDIVLLFNFDLKPSDDYTFQRIDSEETDTHHNAKVHYLYLLYPLKSGEVKVHFDLVKRVTNDESVAYSFSGDRDNVKGLVTEDTKIDLPPLTLHVKALPKGTQIVGDFNLTYDLKQKEAKAYEPIPFQVTISGEGYPPLLTHLLPRDTNFTLFSEKPIIHTSHSQKGTQNKIIYPMALSHNKSFVLPAIMIRAFNPQKEQSYTLEIPLQKINIDKRDINELVDKVDTPPPLSTDWSWMTTLFGYLLAFASGFAAAWLVKWQKKRTKNTAHPLIEKINVCNNKKMLLQLLLAHDAAKFSKVIAKLEKELYWEGTYSLKSLKQEAKEQLI